jgi:hypothetical protein
MCDQAACVDRRDFSMQGIEIWKLDDSGRVYQLRAYYPALPEGVALDESFRLDHARSDASGEASRSGA